MERNEENYIKDFPLEKILSVSAREYVESVGKQLSNYKMLGVGNWMYESGGSLLFGPLEVPRDTEVVVAYGTENTINGRYEYGTALISRSKVAKKK